MKDLECKRFLEEHFAQVDTYSFYRDVFGWTFAKDENDGEYSYHGTIMFKAEDGKYKHIKLWRDLDGLSSVQGKECVSATIAPCAYVGLRRLNTNVRWVYGFTIDIDHLKPGGTEAFFHQVKHDLIPCPTYCVWSGGGFHAYWIFEKAMPFFEENRISLQRYKTALSRSVLNQYITYRCKKTGSSEEKQEIEAFCQPMRVVGSGIKDGDDIARAYATGERITIAELNKFVPRESQIVINTKSSKAAAAEKYKEWGQERLEEKRPRRYWHVNKKFYAWWLRTIKEQGTCGHRYFCVMMLAVIAKKCDVDRNELRRDAYSLLPMFDSLSPNENERFTERDIESALRGYEDRYQMMSRDAISRFSAIEIRPCRRNGRSRADHLEYMAFSKKQKKRTGNMHSEGRPSKAALVKMWRYENPEGTKSECAKSLNISLPTVRKHWSLINSFKELNDYIDDLDEKQQQEFFVENKATLEEIMAMLQTGKER